MARLEALNAVNGSASLGKDRGRGVDDSGPSIMGGVELFLFSGSLLEAVNRISKATGLDRSAVICEAVMVLEEKLKMEAGK